MKSTRRRDHLVEVYCLKSDISRLLEPVVIFHLTAWCSVFVSSAGAVIFESHQSSGEAQDGEERPGGGEGCVLADSRLFPHLHVCSRNVISQCLGHHWLAVLALSNVTSKKKNKLH